MTNSTFLQHIFSGRDTHILLHEEAPISSQIRILIDDIRSGKNTHIELDTFYDSFDLYQDLQHKKKRVQQAIAPLDMHAPDYISLATEIQQISEEESIMRANILDLALSLDKMRDSEKIQQIKQAYTQGSLKQVEDILPEDYLITQFNQYLHNQQQLEQVSEQLVDNANEFLVKAEITNLNYEREDRFEKAIFYYEKGQISVKVSKKLSHIAAYQYDYAFFLQRHFVFPQARTLYLESLEIKRTLNREDPGEHAFDLSMILNNLGILCSNTNEFAEAVSFFEESLLIRRKLAENEPEYRHEVAATLNNLSVLHSDTNDHEKARSTIKEALEIKRTVAEAQPALYLSSLAMTLNNYGELLRENSDFIQAQIYFQEALTIQRQLVTDNPEELLPEIAATLNNSALSYALQNRFSLAQAQYEEAIAIRKELAQKNKQAYLPDAAMAMNNLGELFRTQHQFEAAESLYQDALEAQRQLAIENPQTFLIDVAMTLNNLGELFRMQDQFSLAQPRYEEAIEIERKLVEIAPPAYLPYLAGTLNNLAILKKDQGEYQEAARCFKESLAIYQQSAEVNPEVFLPDVAMALNNLAELHTQQESFHLAASRYEEALDLYSSLAEEDAQAFLPGVIITASNLSILYINHLPDQKVSVKMARLTLASAIQLEEVSPMVKNCFHSVIKILKAWGEDPAAMLRELTDEQSPES
ncbi:tetratricopeptide repeat protein [Flavilitoribacter nigricans]|uniref:Uncharacterized protein n=1 Tax=Flavilitoribacter nigricans (strain ATCC 23147 / DSM 23189 / NBRC 102662 / NCIMB 1420 / SS-2) TaxID=1122177 RepID=A0A2D0NHY4_FLAN2|nr:tetratricopeptide repeat protein [Flavilitoribacter nigricans]PHN07779.1 hypothetical protein CRP01_04470 [Flavilitoribacter nigricans DSM 23189 = NBRC 102662]